MLSQECKICLQSIFKIYEKNMSKFIPMNDFYESVNELDKLVIRECLDMLHNRGYINCMYAGNEIYTMGICLDGIRFGRENK